MVRLLLPALCLSVVLAGCRSGDGQETQQAMINASLSAAVQAKLTADRAFNSAKVDVDARQGVVYLRGEVSSAAQRAKAEELARQVEGVAQVDNQLRVPDHGTDKRQ